MSKQQPRGVMGSGQGGSGQSSMPGLGENYAHRFGPQFTSFRELPEPREIGHERDDAAWDGRPDLVADPSIVGADLDDYEPVGESGRRGHTGWLDRTGFSGTSEAAYVGDTPRSGPGSRDEKGMTHYGTITRDQYYRIQSNEDEARRSRGRGR